MEDDDKASSFSSTNINDSIVNDEDIDIEIDDSSSICPKINDDHQTTEDTQTENSFSSLSIEQTSNEESSSTPPVPNKKYSFKDEFWWTKLQYYLSDETMIKTPEQIQDEIEPPQSELNQITLNRIQGSIFGMAIGDALGAHVEFRPRAYLESNPVQDFQAGGTWGLKEGQFTDDTSMALCLALSLIDKNGLNLYDQLVKYKWWYRYGFMSSTGHCFDIGAATSSSIEVFEHRQRKFAKDHKIEPKQIDSVEPGENFNVFCSEEGVAGNGALMRLGPVPLFFYRYPKAAIEYSGLSGKITHGDIKARDACRYYGALIVAALHGFSKEKLLHENFYKNNQKFFHEKLHDDIIRISEGSFKKEHGYQDGIRGKGYIVPALEAALWAFWSTDNFRDGALAAVNLGDDTDTTAAIYGQLAGAVYGYEDLHSDWKARIYAPKFLERVSQWLLHRGNQWEPSGANSSDNLSNTGFPIEPVGNTDSHETENQPSHAIQLPRAMENHLDKTNSPPSNQSSIDEASKTGTDEATQADGAQIAEVPTTEAIATTEEKLASEPKQEAPTAGTNEITQANGAQIAEVPTTEAIATAEEKLASEPKQEAPTAGTNETTQANVAQIAEVPTTEAIATAEEKLASEPKQEAPTAGTNETTQANGAQIAEVPTTEAIATTDPNLSLEAVHSEPGKEDCLSAPKVPPSPSATN